MAGIVRPVVSGCFTCLSIIEDDYFIHAEYGESTGDLPC